MSTRIDAGRTARAVPLQTAVFCAGCETVSNSPHDVCSVCGSRSLTGLWRLLGGKLPDEKAETGNAKYNLELTAKVREVPAAELDQLLKLLTRLAELSGDLGCLHLNLESVVEEEALSTAA